VGWNSYLSLGKQQTGQILLADKRQNGHFGWLLCRSRWSSSFRAQRDKLQNPNVGHPNHLLEVHTPKVGTISACRPMEFPSASFCQNSVLHPYARMIKLSTLMNRKGRNQTLPVLGLVPCPALLTWQTVLRRWLFVVLAAVPAHTSIYPNYTSAAGGICRYWSFG